MTDENVVYDLTEVIRGAKRGRKRDVAHLINFLDKGRFFIPIVEGAATAKSGVQVSQDQFINPHLIQHPDGPLYGVVTTRQDLVQVIEDRVKWKTDGGPLQYAQVSADMALNIMLKLMEEEKIMGLIINPYDDSNLQLNPREVDALHHKEAIPFVAYAHASPMGPDESLRILRREQPLPENFIQIVEEFASSQIDINSYEIVESYNEERDLEPNILINIKTSSEDCDFSSIANTLIAKTQNILSPARNIIIFFNEVLPESI